MGKDKRRQVALWTMGGQHYTNLKILEYRDGILAELFSNGSACEVDADLKAYRPAIRVGRSNWSDPEWNYATGKRLWNVYSWNGKAFVFDSKRSTTKETTEEEEMGQYMGEVMGNAGR